MWEEELSCARDCVCVCVCVCVSLTEAQSSMPKKPTLSTSRCTAFFALVSGSCTPPQQHTLPTDTDKH